MCLRHDRLYRRYLLVRLCSIILCLSINQSRQSRLLAPSHDSPEWYIEMVSFANTTVVIALIERPLSSGIMYYICIFCACVQPFYQRAWSESAIGLSLINAVVVLKPHVCATDFFHEILSFFPSHLCFLGFSQQHYASNVRSSQQVGDSLGPTDFLNQSRAGCSLYRGLSGGTGYRTARSRTGEHG